MLVLLVNDKRKEIAILRSLGASTRQIATLFALAGVIIGLLGFLLGTLIAWVTMAYVGDILQLIGHFQGFDAFDMLLHGADLPSTISSEALSFVGLATLLIALIAGLVPAVRASLLNPSELLKSA
jgi:ABC-type transport system, involved in lipoprotein release, permease component